MLLSFRFGNHRSFRDEQQLNLTPVYDGDGQNALPAVGVFGANASGKSNLLHALNYMRGMALRSDREVEPGFGLAREPFLLDLESPMTPSRYVVDLSINGVRHAYGLTIDGTRVLEEWAHYWPLGRKRIVFDRRGDGYRWGEESSDRPELARIAEITAPTALFLSVAARFSKRREPYERQNDPLHDIYRWFLGLRMRQKSVVHGIRFWPSPWPDNSVDRNIVIDLLRAADIGIEDVRLKPPTQDTLFPDPVPANDEAVIRRRVTTTRDMDARNRQRLQFAHKGANGSVLFEFEQESTGTQQLLELAIDTAYVIRAGAVMTVDEIDSSLHPMLTAKLINLFRSPRTNPKCAQLVFTSHDATLLGSFDGEEVLERDQIWFAEKDDQGTSVIYPLSDFKPRKDENRQRRYLNGNYGGIPDLSTDLFEQALAVRGIWDNHGAA